MPRSIPVALKAHYQGKVVEIAICFRIMTTDGQVFAYTTHDNALTISSIRYVPEASVKASAIHQSTGTEVDAVDLLGIIGGVMSDDDIRAGVYDQAEVAVFQVNWADLTMGELDMLYGFFGEFSLKSGQYTGELRSLVSMLKQSIGWTAQPLCLVRQFGDGQCNPPGGVASYQTTSTVTAVTDTANFSVGNTHVTDYYTNGVVLGVSGLNAGRKRVCKTHTKSGSDGVLVMRDAFPFTVQAGDTFLMTAGCRRRFIQDCDAKFANSINFRGLPLIPGNDQMIAVGRGS